jgi:hypothetical protein
MNTTNTPRLLAIVTASGKRILSDLYTSHSEAIRENSRVKIDRVEDATEQDSKAWARRNVCEYWDGPYPAISPAD